MKRLLHGNMHHEHIEHRKIGQEYNTKKQYYWIWAMSEKTGDAIIYGYRTSELEAQQVANKIHNAECEITPLPTSNEAEASRMLRAVKLSRTGDVDKTLRRFSHRYL
jgi:hypothetical protein